MCVNSFRSYSIRKRIRIFTREFDRASKNVSVSRRREYHLSIPIVKAGEGIVFLHSLPDAVIRGKLFQQ